MRDKSVATASTRSRKSPFTQDPHAVREQQEHNLEIATGLEVRAHRKKLA
jgi:hypothetical protein